MDIYGKKGSQTGILINKSEEGVLLERGSVDTIPVEIEDISPLKMIRLSHDGKGKRPHWFCEKVNHQIFFYFWKILIYNFEGWTPKHRNWKSECFPV